MFFPDLALSPDEIIKNATEKIEAEAKKISAGGYTMDDEYHLLKDGDRIALGNVVIDCVATPGHTAGTFSFFWDIEEEGKIYRAGTMGGAGLNSMQSAYIRKHGLEKEDWRGAFRKSIARCRKEKVDVFIGNHIGHCQTVERCERLFAGDKFAFVDPEAWGRFLDKCEANIDHLEATDPL